MLIPFCWGFIGILLLLIIVPFARGKSDLITSWNLFLLGSINYVGIAGLNAGNFPELFRVLEYSRADYVDFITGVMAFFISLVLVYHYFKFPRKMAGRTMRKWPPGTPAVLYFILAVSIGMAVLSLSPPPIPGVRQIIAQLGNKAIVLAVAVSFAAWFRDRTNPILIGTLIVVVMLSLLLAIAAGGGRRTMLGVVAAIPICLYWFMLRYRSFTYNAIVFGTLGALSFLLLLGYSQVRHFDRRGENTERSLANSASALLKLPTTKFDATALNSMLGQNSVQFSLAAIHLYRHDHETEPFHAIYYVSTNWIPRIFWENKPIGLGYTLPKTAQARGTRATWGPGIVGHGYHEGGWPMLVFYAVLVASSLRYLDELIVREPRNAYLLAAFAAMSGHIFGWTRGDIGTFTIQIIGAVLVLLLLGILGRVFFGTGVVYPRTDGPEFVNRNLFALRRKPLAQPSPTDFAWVHKQEVKD